MAPEVDDLKKMGFIYTSLEKNYPVTMPYVPPAPSSKHEKKPYEPSDGFVHSILLLGGLTVCSGLFYSTGITAAENNPRNGAISWSQERERVESSTTVYHPYAVSPNEDFIGQDGFLTIAFQSESGDTRYQNYRFEGDVYSGALAINGMIKAKTIGDLVTQTDKYCFVGTYPWGGKIVPDDNTFPNKNSCLLEEHPLSSPSLQEILF